VSHLIETDDKIILIPHIPKTAGISVAVSLANYFDFIYGHSEWPSQKDCSALTRRINGHVGVQECQKAIVDFCGDRLKDKETILISVVRDPWSWWKSWFYFIPQVAHLDSDFDLEFEEIYKHNNLLWLCLNRDLPHHRDYVFEVFLLWMKENRHRCLFGSFHGGNWNSGLPSRKYDQMVDWTNGNVFDFDKSYLCETQEIRTKIPEFFSELGFDYDIEITTTNTSRSCEYSNDQIYNEYTRKIVEDFHKEDIKKYGFDWDTHK
jgi:hypothetical protein